MYTMNERRGLTLTELLVTISILVIVTSVLAPLLTPSLEGREVREAARQVSSYIQQARAKARELGRPVGVVISRGPVEAWAPDRDFGYQISLAEEPPPYSGFDVAARAALIGNDENADGTTFTTARIVDTIDTVSLQRLIQPNDYVRFNFRGPKYRLLKVKPVSTGTFDIVFDTTNSYATLPQPGGQVPFQIFRRPKTSVSTPLEMQTGTALIMSLSGVGMDYLSAQSAGTGQYPQSSPAIGLTEFQRMYEPGSPPQVDMTQAEYPLTIMFTPEGGVDRIYRYLPNTLTLAGFFPPKRPQDKIFLFVGRDGIDHWTNLLDTSNLWIAIDPQTGLVNTAPNLPPAFQPNAADGLRAVAESRQIAATGQNMGGG